MRFLQEEEEFNMADIRKQQSQPSDPGIEAAHRPGSAIEAAAKVSGDALNQSGTAGARVAEQGGRAVSEGMRRSHQAGAEANRLTSGGASDAARRGAELAAEAQQHFVEHTAEQLNEVGRRLAQALEQTAEDVRMLMPPPHLAADGLRDMQQALAGLMQDTTRANLRITGELFRLVNPSAVISLQQRFARECLGALAESQAAMLRAAHRATEEALRPIKQRISQHQSRWPGADLGGQQRQVSRIADVMTRGVRVASPEDSIQQAACAMREDDTGVLPVGENDRLVGMVTDRDIALRLVAEGIDPARAKVREVMTPEVRYVFEDEELDRAVESMAEQQIRRLPVVNRDKRLVGIISLGDFAGDGEHPRRAGDVLADVSRPGGAHSQTGGGVRH
jgi:CBS domain-containing protein